MVPVTTSTTSTTSKIKQCVVSDQLMPSPSNLLCGSSLARERMQEKAEQVREHFVLFFLENVFLCQDRLARMNTKQKPGTPLVEN